MNVEKIKQLVDERDKAQSAAYTELNETVAGLGAEFDDEQRKLAQSFVDREQKAHDKARKAHDKAVADFDAALKKLADETMKASIPAEVVDKPKVREVPVAATVIDEKTNNGKALGKAK
jgi:uncharacterized protein YukE